MGEKCPFCGIEHQKNFLKNPLLPPKGGSLMGDFSYTQKFLVSKKNFQKFFWAIQNPKILKVSKEPPPKGGGFQPFENNKLLDSITDKATKIAEEFTDKSFPTIWGIGMGSIITIPMSRKSLARFMFLTGATQILTEHLMDEHEKKCNNKVSQTY